MNPTIKVFFGRSECCYLEFVVELNQFGVIKLKEKKNEISYELFRNVFSTSRYRYVGYPRESKNGKEWGYCEYVDLLFILETLDEPWSFKLLNPLKAIAPDPPPYGTAT